MANLKLLRSAAPTLIHNVRASQAAACQSSWGLIPHISRNSRGISRNTSPRQSIQWRCFSSSSPYSAAQNAPKSPTNIEQNITEEEQEHFDNLVAQDKNKQIRTPWMREGAERPPVAQPRSAGAMVRGKLLTTPARLLKLVIPLTTRDHNTDRKSVEPLALLVHPQQPLSYLERLIQAELPVITTNDKERIPTINFNAADSMAEDAMEAPGSASDPNATESGSDKIAGDPVKSQSNIETYSGKGRDSDVTDEDLKFVRWSKSTEIGDFIRDAARGREFGIEIEGAPREIRVAVPSFNDRTYYLRMRLRKKAREIASMASIKKECDIEAHNHGQRIAYAGFGGMVAWGGVVAWLTFMTDLGWDVMEPVTYLAGLFGILMGYLWFLLNRREASYQSAMNLTVSRRQQHQYNKRNFNLQKWQYLVDEGNHLRKEIIAIANEYDVHWDESSDSHDESVIKALKKQRHGKKNGREEDDDGGDDDDGGPGGKRDD